MKRISAILMFACLVARGQVDTRVHETQVRGLSSALDALSDEAVALTNQFVGGPAVNAYASNAVSTYVSGFLPGLVGTYTFPFTTNAPLTFSDDTALTFGSLSASNVVANKAYVAGAASSDLIDSEYAFLRGVRALTNLVSSSVLASGSIDSSRVVAGTLTVPAVGVSTAAVGTITSASGTQGVVVAGTNSLSFTGDVFVVDPGSADSRTRRHVVVHDAAAGGIWYDPAVAVADESSVLVSRASPLGLAAFPQAGSTGYQGVAGRTGFSPVFGGGPVAMSALPSSTSFASTRQQPGPYRLLVDQLPAVDAYQTASIMLRASPLDPQPPIDIPPLPPPWEMPPLPPLLDVHEVNVYVYDGDLGSPLFGGKPFFSWLVPEGETGAFVCPLRVAVLAAGGSSATFDVTTRPADVDAFVVVTNGLQLYVSGIEESFDVDVVVHVPPPTVFIPMADAPPPYWRRSPPDPYVYWFYSSAPPIEETEIMRHDWSEFRYEDEHGWGYDMEAIEATLDAVISNTPPVVEIDGTLELPYLSKKAAFYGPHDRLVGIDIWRDRNTTGFRSNHWEVCVDAHYVRELFFQGAGRAGGPVSLDSATGGHHVRGAFYQGVGIAIRVYQDVMTQHRVDGFIGIDSGGGGLPFASIATNSAGVSYIGPIVTSAVEWGSSNLPPFTVSSRAPMTAANNMDSFYESGDALYSMESFGTTYRNAFNPHATGYDPLIVYDRVDFGTSVYDPGIPDYLARQFVYEPLGGGARVARDLKLIDTYGNSLRLFRDRTRLYVQRVDTPYLQFIRHYDGAGDVVLDVSSANHMFVVDGKGSPGESGFGDSGVAMLMSSNQADAVERVEALRDEATGCVKYRVYRRKRYPQ